MTLGDLLPLIAHNPKLSIKIMEADNTAIITFDAAGYAAISSELNARDLDKITIAEVVHDDVLFKLYLKELPPEPEPDPEPEPTPDPEPDDPTAEPEPTDPTDPDDPSGDDPEPTDPSTGD